MENPVVSLWAAPMKNGRWFGFFNYVNDLWCSDVSEARIIDLYEDPEGDYYGWLDLTKNPNRVCLVQPSKMQWEMQSPDFFKRNIELGEGRLIRLRAVPRVTDS